VENEAIKNTRYRRCRVMEGVKKGWLVVEREKWYVVALPSGAEGKCGRRLGGRECAAMRFLLFTKAVSAVGGFCQGIIPWRGVDGLRVRKEVRGTSRRI
jgi:hypothetical protein